MNLLARIERYLRRSGMAATTFGREATGDPGFVRDLRNGREPRSVTAARVCAYIDRRETEARRPCAR